MKTLNAIVGTFESSVRIKLVIMIRKSSSAELFRMLWYSEKKASCEPRTRARVLKDFGGLLKKIGDAIQFIEAITIDLKII